MPYKLLSFSKSQAEASPKNKAAAALRILSCFLCSFCGIPSYTNVVLAAKQWCGLSCMLLLRSRLGNDGSTSSSSSLTITRNTVITAKTITISTQNVCISTVWHVSRVDHNCSIPTILYLHSTCSEVNQHETSVQCRQDRCLVGSIVCSCSIFFSMYFSFWQHLLLEIVLLACNLIKKSHAFGKCTLGSSSVLSGKLFNLNLVKIDCSKSN